jgi:DNA-binding XRE family transcriptional regulator
MPSTHKFSTLRERAERDPARAARIAKLTSVAVAEHAEYQLGELRRALGITQTELANLIGKSQSAVSQIESGEIGLSLDVLRSIIAQLGGELEITAVFDNHRVPLDA